MTKVFKKNSLNILGILIWALVLSGCAASQSMKKLASDLPEQTQEFENFQIETLEALGASYDARVEQIKILMEMEEGYLEALESYRDASLELAKAQVMAQFDAKVRTFLNQDLAQEITTKYYPKIIARRAGVEKEIAHLKQESKKHPTDQTLIKKLSDLKVFHQHLQAAAYEKHLSLKSEAWIIARKKREKLEGEMERLFEAHLGSQTSAAEWLAISVDADLITKLTMEKKVFDDHKLEVTRGYASLISAQREIALEMERGPCGRGKEALTQIAQGAVLGIKESLQENLSFIPSLTDPISFIQEKVDELTDSLEDRMEDIVEELEDDVHSKAQSLE